MNQECIGKFISKQRKEKKLTQQELAEKLGVSTNAVSKWERGLCLMDMSLLKPLSSILDVSITEILNGEKLTEKEIVNKSEETIVKISELYELKSMKYGIIGMALFFMILVIISSYKGLPVAGLTSLICVYNAITFFSQYRFKKDKTDLFTSIMFIIAAILNLVAFILF